MANTSLILKVVPEDVNAKATQINIKKNNMEETLAEIDKTIRSLEEVFDSTSGKVYLEKYGKLKLSVMSALEMLDRNVNCLKRVAEEFDNKGTTLTNTINELSEYQAFE